MKKTIEKYVLRILTIIFVSGLLILLFAFNVKLEKQYNYKVICGNRTLMAEHAEFKDGLLVIKLHNGVVLTRMMSRINCSLDKIPIGFKPKVKKLPRLSTI